jgi:probable rRNA maturation factor
MNVKVELENDCPDHWIPPLGDMERWLNVAGDRLTDGPVSTSVSVRVVDEAESASLNCRYRDKNQATNVLSFACELPDSVRELLDTVPLGDLAVCAPLVDSEAKQQGKTLESHWAHLLTHGFLHLNGFRHNTDSEAEVMETAEIAILNSLGFSNPYMAS